MEDFLLESDDDYESCVSTIHIVIAIDWLNCLLNYEDKA